ncbi:MAG: HAMP domain-containing sensor histidine kinase, partial [Opitutaceae bacterium]
PLFTLSGRLYLATEGLGKMDEPALRRNLQEASRAADHLSTIVDELLLLALVRQESIKTKMTALDMGAIVTESLAALASQLTASAAVIQQPGQWPTAVGYAPWLIQVWVNYISNALKYGGPSTQITLGSTVRADGSMIRFWVKDDGPGLDAASQQGMFVPFTRITKVSATSHGLGLSIVRRIMEKLGGTVGVESQLGAGALFWFELPAAVAVNPTAAAD